MKIMCVLMVVLLFLVGACSSESGLQSLLGIDSSAPVFLKVKNGAEDQIIFHFSEAVQVTSINFDPKVSNPVVEANSTTVTVTFAEPLREGLPYVADIVVEDLKKNSLSALIPFRGKNMHPPELLITEVRTEYAKTKVEFVELYAKTKGQLGGLALFTTTDALKQPLYEFPHTEVNAGTYIVVHLRTLIPESFDEVDETKASPGPESSSARDFWVQGNKKHIHKNEAFAIIDQDQRVIDALVLAEEDTTVWPNENTQLLIDFLSTSNAWQAKNGNLISPVDAVRSKNSTTTRTVCRLENQADGNQSSDWYITATGGATPGAPNKTRKYESSSYQR